MFNYKHEKQHHLLYKITNKINGKYYIGVHSTDSIDDGYMGSGKLIKRAVEHYGPENFVREIVFRGESREEVLELEELIVSPEFVKLDESYNLSVGGSSMVDSKMKQGEDIFINHQRSAGLKGGPAFYSGLSEEEKKEWHRKGAAASHASRRLTGYQHTKPDNFGEIMREHALSRPRYQCPYCDKQVDGGNMIRHLKSKNHGLSHEDALLKLDEIKGVT